MNSWGYIHLPETSLQNNMFPDVIVTEDTQSPTSLTSYNSSDHHETSRAESSRAKPSRAYPTRSEPSRIPKVNTFPAWNAVIPLIHDQKCTLLTRHLLGGWEKESSGTVFVSRTGKSWRVLVPTYMRVRPPGFLSVWRCGWSRPMWRDLRNI
jgi:hypothetical protein